MSNLTKGHVPPCLLPISGIELHLRLLYAALREGSDCKLHHNTHVDVPSFTSLIDSSFFRFRCVVVVVVVGVVDDKGED